jgi:hypothetical protein
MDPDQGEQAFIVRVWREGRDAKDAAPIWRGAVSHVTSGELIYFQSPDRLVAFIIAKTGAEGWEIGPAPPGRRENPWRALLACLGLRAPSSRG